MAGLVLFSAASLACGLSQSDTQLIVFRAIQGLGAAVISPAALAILTTTFAEGEERNKALGIWGAIAGIGGAVGVLLGGILTDKVGWEWIFFLNVPIGLIVILAGQRVLQESRSSMDNRSLDMLGAILVTAGLTRWSTGWSRPPRTAGRRPGCSARWPAPPCCWPASSPSSCAQRPRSCRSRSSA